MRKSSARVTLLLIGVAALSGCGEQRRDMYASREDCLADWGNKPEDCVAGSGGHGGVFYGPSYTAPWWRGSSGFGRTGSHAVSSVHASSVSRGSVSRGGFGSTGHSGGG
jgi:uncharacterized protein YgiB involved in biofilm formation